MSSSFPCSAVIREWSWKKTQIKNIVQRAIEKTQNLYAFLETHLISNH